MHFSTSLMLTALIGGVGILPAAAKTLLVPQQYPTIASALKSAHGGDTVRVSSRPHGGVYSEAVVISKRGVTLQGVGNPVLDGTALVQTVTLPYSSYTTCPDGIDIQASGVTVSGFTIRNFTSDTAGTGINVGGTDPSTSQHVGYGSVTLSANTLTNDLNGIAIQGYNGADPLFGDPNAFYTKGYQVVGNTVSGCGLAASVNGDLALVAGNTFVGNTGDGLDLGGQEVTATGNQIMNNAQIGLNVSVLRYDPAGGSAAAPIPAPTVVAFNTLTGNQGGGVDVTGTATVLGNAITGSGGQGVLLAGADYSTITGNQITGTLSTGHGIGSGQGVYGEYGGSMTISYNQISRNAGGGVYFFDIAGSLVLGNAVIGNQGIGIFLFPYTYQGGTERPPDTVTLNVAQGNSVFDAVDLISASPTIPITLFNAPFYGAGLTTANVWTKNSFGTTDPVGLGR